MSNESRQAKRQERRRKRSILREVLSWVLCILAAVTTAVLLRTFVFEMVRVDGSSMLPTLHSEQTVFVEKVSRYFDGLDRGQIIIVEYPGREGAFVKRVIGLPGDTVEAKDGTVYVNGQPQSEPYLLDETGEVLEITDDMERITVPDGHYFVMGDNRDYSMDSRDPTVGPIPKENVIGHAMFVIWPLGEMQGLGNA
ncbi:MAG: signal peptidase I [Christensenellaceae bacterium]|nr:signal peptidase I [Christensenellaceae bacterium]